MVSAALGEDSPLQCLAEWNRPTGREMKVKLQVWGKFIDMKFEKECKENKRETCKERSSPNPTEGAQL